MKKYIIPGIFLFLVSFSLSAQKWEQKGSSMDEEKPGDGAGTSCSISDDGSVVAYGGHGNDGFGADAGFARVFEWDENADNWKQRGKDIDGLAKSELTGRSICLSGDGNRIVIGGYGAGAGTGVARVFEWSNGSWAQLGSDITGVGNVWLGFAVSMNSDGNIIAVGARFGNGTGYTNLYELKGANWVQKGSTLNGANGGSQFGSALALDSTGNRVIVGAPQDKDGANSTGSASVYEWNETNSDWEQLGAHLTGSASAEEYGFDVDISEDGNVIIIGAPMFKNGSSTETGMANVFKWDGSSWKKIGDDIKNSRKDANFGHAVALSRDGAKASIGEPGYSSDKGRVLLYDIDVANGTWTKSTTTFEGNKAKDRFGSSMWLANSGLSMVVGAPAFPGVSHISVFAYQEPATGLVEVQNHMELSVSPNPTNTNSITIHGEKLGGIGHVSISDLSGREIFAETVVLGQAVDLSVELNSGTYVLQLLLADNSVLTSRIVKH